MVTLTIPNSNLLFVNFILCENAIRVQKLYEIIIRRYPLIDLFEF